MALRICRSVIVDSLLIRDCRLLIEGKHFNPQSGIDHQQRI